LIDAVVVEPDAPFYIPSHFRTQFSTNDNSEGDRAPILRNSLTVGIVRIFCASNAHGRKKRSSSGTSNLEFRVLVVCGIRVTKARSCSKAGTLNTKQGRTFAAIPKSTNHTSPLRGSAIFALFSIESEKQLVGHCRQLVIRKGIGRQVNASAQYFRRQFPLILRRQGIKIR
jgi:hypothetical protein